MRPVLKTQNNSNKQTDIRLIMLNKQCIPFLIGVCSLSQKSVRSQVQCFIRSFAYKFIMYFEHISHVPLPSSCPFYLPLPPFIPVDSFTSLPSYCPVYIYFLKINMTCTHAYRRVIPSLFKVLFSFYSCN